MSIVVGAKTTSGWIAEVKLYAIDDHATYSGAVTRYDAVTLAILELLIHVGFDRLLVTGVERGRDYPPFAVKVNGLERFCARCCGHAARARIFLRFQEIA